MKLSADGRTMLRGSYGRFSQGVLSGELSPFHPGAKPTTTAAFVPPPGGYTSIVSVVDPRRNLQLDANVRAPRTDEYSIGVDREVGRRLAVAIAYVRKEGSNFIGWTDVGGQYREETRTLPDGQSVPVLVLANGTAARRFLLTNPEGYSMTYNGLVIAAEKRRSHGWQAFGSYTLSKASGLQASSGAIAAGSQISTIAGTPFGTFGQDPNTLTNARGRLPNDRPHMFRVMGSVDVPRTGFVVAANLQHFSGKPWAATAQISLPQGDQRVLLEPRGSRRLSVAVAARCAPVADDRGWWRRAHRAARGRPQCAQRQSGGGDRYRQSVQPEFRPVFRVHRSAPRDAQHEAEPG